MSPIYAPTYLLSAGLVWAALSAVRARARGPVFRAVAAVLALTLGLLALADHRRFAALFVERGIPDLATPWFRR